MYLLPSILAKFSNHAWCEQASQRFVTKILFGVLCWDNLYIAYVYALYIFYVQNIHIYLYAMYNIYIHIRTMYTCSLLTHV